MSTKDTSNEPAFPTVTKVTRNEGRVQIHSEPQTIPGLTKRQYAAIKLRVPDSGEEWLDAMIRQSLRDEFAGKAMQASYMLWMDGTRNVDADSMGLSREAYCVADSMLKARIHAQDAQ